MDVGFYGVRGSIASPLTASDIEAKFRRLLDDLTPEDLVSSESRRAFLENQPMSLKGTYGCNTTSMVFRSGESWLVIDCGTGVRRFGQECVEQKRIFTEDNPLTMLFTHMHWDHIQGFPFFVPCYIPINHIKIASARPNFKEDLLHQQISPWSPAHFDFMKSNMSFEEFDPTKPYKVGPWTIKTLKVHHPDENVGYRVEADGASFVFLSDTEITNLRQSELRPYQDFCRGADGVYVDCQYDYIGAHQKVTWGHSTVYNWLDLFRGLDIGEMHCGHYDPTSTDEEIETILKKALTYAEKVHDNDGLPVVKLAVEGTVATYGEG